MARAATFLLWPYFSLICNSNLRGNTLKTGLVFGIGFFTFHPLLCVVGKKTDE